MIPQYLPDPTLLNLSDQTLMGGLALRILGCGFKTAQ